MSDAFISFLVALICGIIAHGYIRSGVAWSGGFKYIRGRNRTFWPFVSILLIGAIVLFGDGIRRIIKWNNQTKSVANNEDKERKLHFPAGDSQSVISNDDMIRSKIRKIFTSLTSTHKEIELIAFILNNENKSVVAYVGLSIAVMSNDSARDDAEDILKIVNEQFHRDDESWSWTLNQLVSGKWGDGKARPTRRHILLRSVVP